MMALNSAEGALRRDGSKIETNRHDLQSIKLHEARPSTHNSNILQVFEIVSNSTNSYNIGPTLMESSLRPVPFWPTAISNFSPRSRSSCSSASPAPTSIEPTSSSFNWEPSCAATFSLPFRTCSKSDAKGEQKDSNDHIKRQ